ncbi:MAG TPA: cytochrome P450 [Sporichthya sp.]|nr:cytochrome P450 [Sporichthya sp.]
MTTPAGPATLDLLSPTFRVLSPEVRAAAAQHWYAQTPLGPAILTSEDCHAMQNDRRLHHSGGTEHMVAQGIHGGPVADMWARLVLNIEGPDHHRLRKLVNPAFAPSAVERLRARIREIAEDLVEGFAGDGRCEFMSQFSDLFPPRVMFHLLGIPDDLQPDFLRWGQDVALLLSYEVAANHDRLAAAIEGICAATDELCAQRRAHPGDDLLSTLVAARDGDDKLSEDEIRAMVTVLVLGGQDSTRNQIALGLATFAEHPDQWALLGDKPELAPAAVEEIVRYNPVDPILWRIAPIDVEYRDLQIAAGTRIWLFAALAQSESDVPGAPLPFDITAERAPHLAFGHGTHYCLGAYLARAEMLEALPLLARRMPDLALDGEPVYRPELSGFVGPVVLPLKFTPTP